MARRVPEGYEVTRKGFLEHVKGGDLSWDAFNLHHWLRLHSRAGICHTSAPYLAAQIGKPVRRVQRWLRELKKGGYIKDFHVQGRLGNYPILIHKAEMWNGTEAVRLNAHRTRAWREPVYERVTEADSEMVSGMGSEKGSVITNNYKLLTNNSSQMKRSTCPGCGQTFKSVSQHMNRSKCGEIRHHYDMRQYT